MLTFNQIYHPLTSRPFPAGPNYMEYQPSKRLRPYIACFWTSGNQAKRQTEVLVTPDTCMDIIVRVNHTRQTIHGYLCGMQDQPVMALEGGQQDRISSFAIRFYFWSAHLFLNCNFKEICNRFLPFQELDADWTILFETFFYRTAMAERISLTESFLLRRLDQATMNADLFNSIQYLLTHCGRSPVGDICAYSGISQRRMERLYHLHVGLPPKRMSSLIRYQNVWHEMVSSPDFDMQDAVMRYGYTDQAHLLKDFKRFHGVNPTKARRIAGICR